MSNDRKDEKPPAEGEGGSKGTNGGDAGGSAADDLDREAAEVLGALLQGASISGNGDGDDGAAPSCSSSSSSSVAAASYGPSSSTPRPPPPQTTRSAATGTTPTTQVGEAQQAAMQQLALEQALRQQQQQSSQRNGGTGNNKKGKKGKKKQQQREGCGQRTAVAAALDALRGDVVVDGGAGGGDSSTSGENAKKHAFWDTQPMLKGEDGRPSAIPDGGASPAGESESAGWHRPIVPDRPPTEIRAEPYNMPRGFEWSDVDVADPPQLDEVYDLLYQNYVEDDECMFRFDYGRDFLTWALTPPGYSSEFHLGVRSTKSNRLMALITGVPARVRVHGASTRSMVEINFLCVHKKLRSKRLAPVLIKEITRRVNRSGVFQAVYTAGVVLPGHVASCRYYHRSLDPRKLVEVGFSRLQPRQTMARLQKLYKLPASTSTPGLRAMTPADVPGAHKLVLKYLQKFQLSVEFTVDEFAHWLLPREGVVSSFVASNPKKKAGDGDGDGDGDDSEEDEITDFCSYYHLHSTVIGNSKHPTLRAAYSFYNVATSVELSALMRDCLVLAKTEDQDVFNALNLMENGTFLDDLKFGVGDGNLQYYVYNWCCPRMDHGDVGIVLL